MSRTRYILGSFSLINIILAGSVFFLVNYTLLPFLHRGVQFTLPVTTKQERIDTPGKDSQDKTKPLSPLDFTIIAEQNLFHPERKIPVAKVVAQPLPKPEFVLFGTIISADTYIAYIEDKKAPYSTPGRGKRPHALKAGQSLSGYTLRKVYHDKVVMVKGEDQITVNVITSNPRTGNKAKK